ncbi:MAG: DUF3488 domain-containing protein [Planctomycetia bacterium]|nr:DUF3488 domain-containing protein [Planctomycetia bacterium]
MHLERVLQIGVAGLAALATVLLSMGELNAAIGLAAVTVAVASVYLTDITGWVRLNRVTADVAGVAAAAFAFYQWQRDLTEAGLLALVNFVIYVQFILQFKHKRIGTYWLLVVLSLMQVAVATALNESLLFGLLLVVYLFSALGVLVVFYLYRESSRAADDAIDERLTVLAAGPSGSARWPVAPQVAVFTGHTTVPRADETLNRPLARLVVGAGGTTLALASVLFLAIPRVERASWRGTEDGPVQRVVGFSNEVELGELGAVSESPEEVMQVWLKNPDTHQPIEMVDEPLFRGVALTAYANRKWSQGQHQPRTQRVRSRPPPQGAPVVKQHFVVQPLDTNVLFSLYPWFSSVTSDELIWDSRDEQISRRGGAGRVIEYDMLTTGIVDRRLKPIVPVLRPPSQEDIERLLALPEVVEGRDPLAGMRALAEKIIGDIPADNPLERARRLNNYLRDPTNFRYSLDAVARDTMLDPVEDFVTGNRVGHCEYFASALALMLRAVGVPSRLAIGFKGGEWMGGYYQVRALHAHAWVEVYLPPEAVPAGELPATSENGGWLILDPTASGPGAAATSTTDYLIQNLRGYITAARAIWRSYVLGMDHDRQQTAIYEPIVEGVVAFATGATNREYWRNFFGKLANLVSPAYWGLANGGWFSWRGALAAIVIMLVFLSLFYAARAIVRLVWRRARAADTDAERRTGGVEFYRRLENLLAHHDFVRGASQTQREFALAVGGQLAESAHTKRAAPLPRHLVESFYRVRFGGRTLDTQEAVAVERALVELAAVLDEGRRSS